MKYSIIVPVHDRPDEIDDLLSCLAEQTFRDFEVIVVEDGSTTGSHDVCKAYGQRLTISHYDKDRSGPGPSRNYGCRRASGDYFIFLDSDCTVPRHYLTAIDDAVTKRHLDAWGGPDRIHDSFSAMQKAIGYSTTSLLTTGGYGTNVRIGGTFYPHAFNMGMSRTVFNVTEGFSRMPSGADVDLHIRMRRHGFKVELITDAWVHHKRHSDLATFFGQMHEAGMARIDTTVRHHGSLKLVHFFPATFTAYVVIVAFYTLFVPYGWIGLYPIGAYGIVILLEGMLRFRSPWLGILCVLASFVRMLGYGTGFIRGMIWRIMLGKPERTV